MRYLNTTTLKQTTEYLDSTTVIDTDPRVANWFTKTPDGYKGEWIDGTYTFVLIPLPTQDELDVIEVSKLQAETNQEALEYLDSTDWYMIRLLEKGTVIPDEITTLRDQSRTRIINE